MVVKGHDVHFRDQLSCPKFNRVVSIVQSEEGVSVHPPEINF